MLKNQHFGKPMPHRHTSYAALLFVVLLAAVVLVAMSWEAQAAPPAVNPQSGSVGLTGRVNGPPPSTAAVILQPQNGSHTSSIPITVSGTCPSGTFVDIEKNNVFAGATTCRDDGTFTIQVDLFSGSNTLVARVADSLGQFGPDSAPVTVFYDAPSVALPAGSAGQQLFLTTSDTVLGGDPGQAIERTVNIVGGVSPYAVSWDWGDDATTLMSQASVGALHASHSYARAGMYQVILRVTDSAGNNAFLQVVTVVNGPVAAFGSSNSSGALSGDLLAAWPLLLLALLMVVVFWLGERREARKLRRRQYAALA